MASDDERLLEVLKWEYDTLRTEIMARQSPGYGFLTVPVAVVALIGALATSDSMEPRARWVLVLLAGLVVFASLWWALNVSRGMGKLSERIAEIEGIVNGLLGDWPSGVGLVWETRTRAQRSAWGRFIHGDTQRHRG
ncbi:hypothetical protein [Nocardioides aquiterrae]|uniref:hypothetical protein n=1 Tax=Nocardioides aquiterrae TaxID=203799 RepID=UPI0031DA7B7E